MTGSPYKASCIVLKKTKLGESDLIYTMLSEEGKQIRAVAKSARKPGNKRFGARLEPLSYVSVQLYHGKSLDSISDCSIIVSNAHIRENLEKNCSALVIVELFEKITRDGEVSPRHVQMLLAYLFALNKADQESILALLDAMLLKSFVMLGIGPMLNNCAQCYTSLNQFEAFSIPLGGCLCKQCSDSVQHAKISHNQIELMSQMLSSTFSELNNGSKDDMKKVLYLSIAWLEEHLSIKLKSMSMFCSIL